MISQINGATHKTTEKLYWGQYGFKVVVQSKKTKTRNRWRTRLTFLSVKEIAILTPQTLPNDAYKVQHMGYSVIVYFKNEQDTEQYLSQVDMKKFIITEVVSPESQSHLDMLSTDHKIVTRKTLFFKHYEWRVVFIRSDNSIEHDVRDWVYGYFGHDEGGVRFSLTEGVNYVLYLRDEDDVVMTKLTQGQRIRKVEKAVILNNDNNKVGTDETRAIPQTD